MPAGVRTEFRHKVRIWQEAHVKQQVSFLRHALLVAEADARNQNAFFRGLVLKPLRNVGAQLVDVELRSINDQVRN